VSAASAPRPACREPNTVAAAHLMNGFRRSLETMARRNSRCAEDAEDAFARTVELALRSCPIEGATAQVERWATVVCRREAWKIARRYRRKPAASLDAVEPQPGSEHRGRELALADRHDPTPEERACDAEALREVYAAIEHLSPNQRCVIDAYANGWSYREIAAALGFSERAVGKMLVRAKRRLRARLGMRP
jgi:RNA polymerase sigma factor (sigma-70 family)